jgi:SAM-dependent methyltransferase
MSNSTCTRQHVLLIAASAVAGAALAVGTMTLTQRKKVAEKNIYESQRSLSEYLLFHYGSASELQQWSFGPRDCLSFPVDLATKAIEFCQARNLNMSRALDIGCAVGRTSFDLSRSFDEVIGIDFSHSFINAARRLAANESLSYDRFDEGDISTRLVAQAPAGARSDRVQFEQGDACALRSDLGSFDLVLGANLGTLSLFIY